MSALSDDEIREALENVKRLRDEKRPPMELVVQTFDKLFDSFAQTGDYRRVLRGPDTWSWLDASQLDLGFEKWFVLSRSAMEETVGYPLVTIRMTVAPRLDSFLSFSQLVVGPGEKEIEYSLAMAVANHMGAFDGFRGSIDDLVRVHGVSDDQFDRVVARIKREMN